MVTHLDVDPSGLLPIDTFLMTPEHVEIIERHHQMLIAMRLSAWAGPVFHDWRDELMRVANTIDPMFIMGCWTCGGDVQVMARLILNAYENR